MNLFLRFVRVAKAILVNDYKLFPFYLAGPSQGSVSDVLQIAVMLERAIKAL
jgi:hypothetical protein